MNEILRNNVGISRYNAGEQVSVAVPASVEDIADNLKVWLAEVIDTRDTRMSLETMDKTIDFMELFRQYLASRGVNFDYLVKRLDARGVIEGDYSGLYSIKSEPKYLVWSELERSEQLELEKKYDNVLRDGGHGFANKAVGYIFHGGNHYTQDEAWVIRQKIMNGELPWEN